MSRATPFIAAGAALVLLAGLGVVVLQRADSSAAFDEDSAVTAFRSGPGSGEPSPAPTGSASDSPAPAPSTAQPAVTPAAPGAGGGPAQSGRTAAPAPGGRAAGGPAAPASPGAPERRRDVEPGVYRYATEGHEQVDALGGARHDYPATSSITYSRKDCGTEERWQPLEGRVGTSLYCAGPHGPEVRATHQEREFFGRSQSESYRCEPGLLVRPLDPRPGQSWTGRCRSDDSTVTVAGRVVALEELDVAGTRVPVVRITIRGTVTGSVRGRTDREVWLARSNGLLVQALGDTDTDADTPAGPVRYRETYRLRLQSLQPRR